ncbi:MAG: ABC transporter substrate-binding protein [Thermodesulfobacteriota bacterium]|nr:ABC transporter substrate-binding protein [Thermodesulfobacteriota bacterium]
MNRPSKYFFLLLIFLIPFYTGFDYTNVDSYAYDTITDMAGRTVLLKKSTSRIISTFKPASLCVFSLGLEKQLVGIDTSSRKDRLFQAVMPEVEKIVAVGSKSAGLNFETMTALKPDLVILYAQKDGSALAEKFKKMGIPAIIILPETFDSVKTSLDIIAAASHEPERAVRVTTAMDNLLSEIKKRTKTIPEHKKITGYFASPRGLFSTATGNMLQDEMFQMAGMINAAHHLNGYFQDISPEQFIKWNPDLVVLSQHMGRLPAKNLKNPAFKTMKAFQSRSIYRFPSNLAPWDFPSPLSALGVLWLGKTAYPSIFSDIQMDKTIDEFHKILFNKTFTEMRGKTDEKVF